MQRRPPVGTARWVRSVMCRERSPFPPLPVSRSLTAKISADFLRRRSGHAAQVPGGHCPLGTERNVPRAFPLPPSSRIPFSNRKNVRRLFAEEERPCSAGPRRALPAGYGA